MHGKADRRRRNRISFGQFFHQAVGNSLFAFQWQEGVNEIHVPIHDGVDIVLDILRIRGYDRTVVVIVCLFEFFPFIRDTWVEDPLYSLVDQPLYMAVGKFRRIALRFAWDRLDPQLIDLPGWSRREYDTKAQGMEEGKPERIILIHV